MQKTFLPREWQGRSTPFQLGPENLSLLFLIALQNGLLLQNCFLTMYGEWLCRFVSEKDSQSLLGKKNPKSFWRKLQKHQVDWKCTFLWKAKCPYHLGRVFEWEGFPGCASYGGGRASSSTGCFWMSYCINQENRWGKQVEISLGDFVFNLL